ncbi:Rhodanese-like domain-containing protein [Geopyxis carbonaria]|nr:Rhodanese-like domain-containing protein [Geopyxis carbonaria]
MASRRILSIIPYAVRPQFLRIAPACRIPSVRRAAPICLPQARYFSQPFTNNPKVYDFAEVKALTESPTPERVLIDVREPSEYTAGYIPGAINIPIASQPDALLLQPDEFEDRFGFDKPSKKAEVVFYCKAGIRSTAAAQIAVQEGYEKVGEYRGSWMDWVKQNGDC